MTTRLSGVDQIVWADHVRAGDRVVWGQANAEPTALTESLMGQRHTVGRFTCFLGLPATATCRPEHADVVRFESYTAGGANRALRRAGCLDILPVPYSALPALMRARTYPVDVVLLLLAPADDAGRYTMGLAHEYLAAAIDSARVVIAVVSDQVPWVSSPRLLTDDELDVVVECDQPPPELERRAATEVELAIAARVAELVEDGSTLQVGIGALPDAVLRGLGGHADLGVHSGAYSDSLAELAALGVVTNRRKSIDAGVSVAGALVGGRRLLEHAGSDRSLSLRSTEYTHDPSVLSQQHRLVALNAALEVDLVGQVNSEVAAGRYVGAYGGACDFAAGARRSTGGRSVVLLPSTAGARTRIVARLQGPVSIPAGEVDTVVTEHGVADLRGRTLEQRRRALLAVAHPAHRDALEEEMRSSAFQH